MKAYGYEVQGDAKVLSDISENLKNENLQINWFNFQTGDIYYTDNGDKYDVEINHDVKTVTLKCR